MRRPPASDTAIDRISQIAPEPLPDEFFELLRFSNGGEGPLNLPPLYFMSYEAEFICELHLDPNYCEIWPGMFQFGSNGGLEAIAFDIRGSGPWPIVMFDPVAGIESSGVIATGIADFIQAIGFDDTDPIQVPRSPTGYADIRNSSNLVRTRSRPFIGPFK